MRNRKLVMALTVPACVALSSMAFAAPTPAKAVKPAAKAAKPAAKPAKKFDQKAVLQKFWEGPDSAVVGTVDGAKVTKGELMKALWDWNSPNMLQDLLNQRMIEQAAKKAKVSLSQAEIQQQIDDSLKRMNMTSVDQLLNQYKITYARFIATIKTSALAQKVVDQTIKISDAEYAEWMKAQHILVRLPQDITDSAKQDEAAKAKADSILARVKAGEDFSKLAMELSDDPGSAQNGGDLGWFTKGRMVPDFEKAAFDLKAGQVSEPIKTPYGYHIIKAEKIGRDAAQAEKAELGKMIREQRIPREMGMWFQMLQSKAKIENLIMPPVEAAPKPMMAPQPGPRPTPRPAPAPPAPKVEAPKPAPAPAEPAASEKPGMPPPPPAPAQ